MTIFSDEVLETTLFEKPAEPSVNNKASEENLKAQAAIVSDQDTLSKYNELSVKPTLEAEEDAKWTIEGARTLDQQMMQEEAINVISDPTYPEEARITIAERFNALSEKQKNSLELTVEKLFSLDNGTNDKSEKVYVDMADLMGDIAEEMAMEQALFNSEELNNEYLIESVGDFLQYMIPFDESVQFANIVADVKEGDLSAVGKAFALLGESKADLRDWYSSQPYEVRKDFATKLAAIVNDTRGIVFTNDNDLAQKDLFMSVVDADYYGDGYELVDNAISILDLVGLGGLLRGLARSSRLAMRRTRASVQPTSPAAIADQVNPKEARTMAQAAIADETGRVAQATHGATREDVVMHTEAPQPRQEDGSVQSVTDMAREEIDSYLEEHLLQYSDQEILTGQLAEAAQFHEVGALHRRAEDSVLTTNQDGSVTISNMYGLKDSGWNDPQEALEATMDAFRYYDIDESQFTLMQKSGTSYVPVTLAEVQAKQALRDELVRKKKKLPEELKKVNMQNEYMVQVNFNRDFDPTKVKHEDLSVAKNFLDRSPMLAAKKKGGSSLTRHFFDAASMFVDRIILSANVAVDRSAAIEQALVKVADKVANKVKGLDPERQEKVFQAMKEQNLLSKRFSREELAAKGFTESESKLFDDWADYWDTVYELENRDMIQSFKNGGWSLLNNKVSGTKDLVVRPIKRRGDIKSSVQAYDSTLDEVVTLTPSQLDELYESGGQVAKLKSATNIDGIETSFAISRNNADEYIRELTKRDRVLNYREGYYTVRYKDPYFIQKVTPDGTRSIKTASSKKAAERIVAEKNASALDGEKYIFVENRDLISRDLDDNLWQVATERGRTSQKLRGERLGSDLGDDLGVIQDPIESVLASARSISRRVSMRDWLDKAKIRFMDEFKDFLPSDGMGGVKYPGSADDFVIPSGTQHQKRLADARSNWEYINSLEYGYRSTLADFWKATLNMIAELVGAKSARGEKAIRTLIEEVPDPIAWLRGRTFDLFMATNPFRQFVVQGHQGVLLTATFTEYVTSQRLLRDMVAIIGAGVLEKKGLREAKKLSKFTGMSVDEMLSLHREYKATGLDATIDRNNLVEAGLDELVETGNFKRTKSVHKAITVPLRKAGFDAGERINLMSSWLAHRNKAIEEGKDLSNARVKAEVLGKARNFTLNMNAAGEMPYNKNSLALLFQFMQVPHKMLTTIFSNRVLSTKDKTKLAAFNALMLPLPLGFIYQFLDEDGLPDDPFLRNAAINGLEGAVINKLAQVMLSDGTDLDFSSFTALDPTSMYELFIAFMEADIPEILANSPSLGIIAGSDSKLGQAVTELGKLTTEPSPENLGYTIDAFLNMSSGYANFSRFFKETFLNEVDFRQRNGTITDENINLTEKVAAIFGIGTTEELINRTVNSDRYRTSQAARDDVKEIYRMQKLVLSRRGITSRDAEFAKEMLNIEEMQALRAFNIVGWSEQMKQAYISEMRKDIGKGEDHQLSLILKSIGWVDEASFHKAAEVTGNEQLSESMKTINSYGGL